MREDDDSSYGMHGGKDDRN